MEAPENLQEHVPLAPYTTMQVGGPADYFLVVDTAAELAAACDWAKAEDVPVFVLGEGSNIVCSDGRIKRLVLKMELPGFEVVSEDAQSVTLRVGAGEHWDDVVRRTVERGWSGIEAMSAIPGTAGAAPVQNAGAYGQETADTLVELEAYDTKAREFVTLARDECGFGYRTSDFKTSKRGRYVITAVTFRLSKAAPARPTYASLRKYLDEHELAEPTVAEIRTAVMAVRARILPDPSVVPNSGSFFKSPIVGQTKLMELEERFENVPSYQYGEDYKIAAGWIVEQCGFKGKEHFGFKVWAGHALVLTNPQHAGYDDLMKYVKLIVKTAEEKFGITLEPEPEFVR